MPKYLLPLALVLLISACTSQYNNQADLVGQAFPQVSGQSLEQEQVVLPKHFEHKPTILLLGYKQDSQFDIDRWLIGLDITETKAPVYELPTIAGMFPRMFKTTIDNGMRRGIPKELWAGVITIYADGDKLYQFY